MPLSYHGFAPAAIFLMILCLVLAQVWKRYQQRKQTRSREEY